MATAPDEFFVFVNQASFWTRHNLGITGRFVSAGFGAAFPEEVPAGTVAQWGPGPSATPADQVRGAYLAGTLDYLPFAPNTAYFGWPTPFVSGVTTDYRVEWDAEVARRAHFPAVPSRLSAIYAFGDMATCHEVSVKHGWNISEVQRFRLVPHEGNRAHRVNMEIVSLMRSAYRRGMWTPDQLDAIWRSYWSGGGALQLELPIDGVRFEAVDSGEISEYLVEGVLERT